MRTRFAAACAALLAVSCAGTEPATPRPISVEPASGFAAFPVRVVIRGDGFLARPSEEQSGGGVVVDSGQKAWLGDAELGDVVWIDVRTLAATVPAGLSTGAKRLLVENAFGRRGVLDDAYEVMASPVAALETTLEATPPLANAGQPTTVTLTVVNLGGAAAREVVPEVLSVGGDAASGAAVTGPEPASVARLDPGGTASFTWTITAAVPGALSLSGRVLALDDLSSAQVSSPDALASVTVQMPAQLTATIAAGRATANVGQAVSVTLSLANGGVARADLTAATPTTAGSAATCSAVTPALPQSVGAGETLQLGWTCTGSAPGELTLAATVTGLDGTSGAGLSASPPSPATVTVQTPASLAATAAVEGNPTVVLVGTPLEVTLTVQDSGQAGASVTRVDPVVTPAGAASCGAPSPAPPRDVAGSGTITFSWSCTALLAGSVTLGATVGGVDANTLAPLQATAPGVTLSAQLPATLVATITASPSTANVGQAVTATLTLFNGGTGTATANISSVTTSASGTATAACGAVTPATAVIPGGGSATFRWACTASVKGMLVLNGTASGTDASSGAPLSATPSTPASVVVQDPPVLGVTSLASSEALAVTGQAVTLTLVLTNTGEAAADVVSVSPSTSPLTASCTAATPAPPQRIAGGTSLTFGWSCTATAAGSYTLGAAVSAVDANTGQLLSPSVAPVALTVQTPAAMTVSAFTASRTTVDTGQAVTLTLGLANGGGTAATVTAVAPSVTPGATASCGAVSPMPPQDLAAGGTISFTWTCSASAAGSYELGAIVSGVAGITSAPLSVGPTPVALSVQRPASLSATLATSGAGSVALGQPVTATLTVSNSGDATANLSSVTASTGGTAAASCTAPAPPPQPLAGGASQAFTWTCTPTAVGSLTLTGSADGVDANTGANLQATASGTVAVVSGTVLAVTTFSASRATAAVDQTVAVTLLVSNTGPNAGTLLSVTPAITPSSTASCGAPSVALPTPVPGGGSVTLDWTCAATAAGAYSLDATISATDAAGQPVPLAPTPISLMVQTPALFAPATLQGPATANVGQAITVSLALSNQGGAAATATAGALGVSGTGSASCGAPSPASQTIPGGASGTFTWTCTGTAAGDVGFSTAVVATDANSGADVSPAITDTTLTVQTPAALVATLTPSSSSVPAESTVGLTLSLLDTGQATAQVTAVTPFITPSGGTSCTSPAPSPPQDVAGGTTSTFTWSCTVGRVKSYTLGATVTATDSNTAAALTVEVPNANLQTLSASPGPVAATTGTEVVLVAVDPLGDGTADPLLGSSQDAVRVGPGADGATVAWFDRGGRTARTPGVGEPMLRSKPGDPPLGRGGQRAAAVGTDLEAVRPAAAGVSALATIAGVVYAADAGGIARSGTPLGGAPSRWIDVTPLDRAWEARTSVDLAPQVPTHRWHARDRAVPSIVGFGRCGGGPCVLAARNVAGGAAEQASAAQLWRCEPRGAPGACRADDWSLVAPDATGLLTQLGAPSGEALTILAVTPRWLYVGLDDRTTGARLYRAAIAPRSAVDFNGRGGCVAGAPRCEGLGGDGFGDPRVIRLLDAKVLTIRGVTSLWIVAGDGVAPARLYRVDD